MTISHSEGSYLPPDGWLDEVHAPQAGPGTAFLLGMTLVGLALRLFKLDGQSLWVDEMMTWEMVRPGIGLHFWQQILDSIQGPLYQAVLWPLLRWQESGLMMRLPAALAGVASIPLLGMVAGKLFGSRTARLATLFWVINPFHVWYSQEARGYSFLLLFVLVSAYLFLKMKDEGPSFRLALAFGFACAAAVWSNMSALFFWAAMGCTWLIFTRKETKGQRVIWLFAFGLGLILVTPWILNAMGIWAIDRVVPGAATGEQLRGETTFSLMALPYTLFTFFFGYSWGPSLRELHSPNRMEIIRAALPLLAVGAIPMAIGLFHGFFKARGRRLLVLVWIALPLAVLVLLAVRNVKPWNARYAAVAFPWLVMLAAHGFNQLPRKTGFLLGALMGGMCLFSLGNHYFQPFYHKADLRAAAAWMQEHNPSAETMLVPVVTTVYNYYYAGAGEVVNTFGHPKIQNSTDAERFVGEVLADQEVVWVVLAREWFFDPGDFVIMALSRQGNLHLEHEETGVRIFKWQRQKLGGGGHGN